MSPSSARILRFFLIIGLLAVAAALQNDSSDDRWEKRISALGAAIAYEEFSSSVQPLSVAERHAAAHAFGAALYRISGLAGFSVCDDRFSYGCFHEFLAQAILERGDGILRDLNARCLTEGDLQRTRSCQHGIGHGILASLGYREEDLLRGLAFCRGLPGTDRLGGCYGGVFMEYNLRSLLLDEGHRPVPGDNFLDPCDSLGGRARLSCFSRLPQWWWELPELKTENAFTLLASRCRDLASSGDERAACAFGVGRQIGSMQQIAEANTARSLSALPGLCQVFRSDRDRGWCLAGAVKRLQEVFPFTLPRGYCSSIGSEFQGPCSALLTAEAGTWYEFEDTEFSAIR